MNVEIEEWLIVDGYNIIGMEQGFQWIPERLEQKRAELSAALSEYQAVTGRRVYLVFDAHLTPGAEVKQRQEGIEIFFTRQDETADEWIERFVRKYRKPGRHIFVATSDFLEQRMIFGQGAYRISGRELLSEIRQMNQRLQKRIHQQDQMQKKPKLMDRISHDIRQKLEQWRRKN
ncbi:hypothetical protein SAMN05444392_107149 [Seinonella peptonophila]|uniref:YacP-like NYN domain-containing protein n=1 Tax=Seinonella peptonophila TaxID=112248 RepID=A0A1M4YUA5_9BACL|nr:NYN domain-containing protein [Seinonella peptonophila]SHF09350.1 hypothetical protein SAMN05444392_107149 [Seinonella peptonophila]